MRISDRLEAVLAMVNPGGSVADIGTDHGYIPLELVRRQIARRALAMDVRTGPLGRAEEHIRAAGLSGQIETRLSDGLLRLAPGEADTVVIAGMGGSLMIRILDEGRHMWDSVKQWVLSPQSDLPEMRRFLEKEGFFIRREDLVFEDGKYYHIFDLKRDLDGETQTAPYRLEDHNYIYSPWLIAAKHPVFLAYLKDEEKKYINLTEQLSPQTAHSERARESLKEIEEKLSYNRRIQYEMQRDH